MIIDLHAHYVPRSFLEAIEKHGAPHGASLRQDGPTRPSWSGADPTAPSPGTTTRQAPTRGHGQGARDMQVLSSIADGVLGRRRARPRGWRRLYNDDLAADGRGPPRPAGGPGGRVPLQDIPAAVQELERAVHQLGLKESTSAPTSGERPRPSGSVPLPPRRPKPSGPGVLHPIGRPGGGATSRLLSPQRDWESLRDGRSPPPASSSAGSWIGCRGSTCVWPTPGGALPYFSAAWTSVYACARKHGGTLRHAPSAYLRRFTYDTIAHSSRRCGI